MPIANLNGWNYFWREAGDGPPVLFIMGLETDHRGWLRLIPQLKHDFRCISFDNRDVGQTDMAKAPYKIEDMASDVVALLDHLGLSRVAVVGQSMGGAVAQTLAHRYPEYVSRLVLLTTFCKIDARFKSVLEGQAAIRRDLPLPTYYKLTWPWMYTPEDYAQPGFLDNLLARAGSNTDPQPADAFARQVAALTAFDSTGWAHEIRQPTLIVGAEADIACPPSSSRQLHSLIRGSQIEMVKDVGHALIMSPAIDPVVPKLVRFLGAETA